MGCCVDALPAFGLESNGGSGLRLLGMGVRAMSYHNKYSRNISTVQTWRIAVVLGGQEKLGEAKCEEMVRHLFKAAKKLAAYRSKIGVGSEPI